MTKTQLKQLFVDYLEAQENCKQLERDAREARGHLDCLKESIVEMHNNGIKLVTGSFEAIVTSSPRDGYVVKPSVRTTVTIKSK